MILPLTLALAMVVAQEAPTQASPQGTGTVRGTVRGEGEAAPVALAFASVRLVGGAVALADSAGAYEIAGVAAGVHRLRAEHPGYAAVEVEVLVPHGGTVALDVELARRPLEIRPLAVTADPLRGGPQPGAPDSGLVRAPAGLAEAALRAVEAGPGMTQAGLGDAAGRLPGGNPTDPADVLFMRGSTADLKLVLLDGAPVFTPFHLGGLIHSFEPGLLGSATLFVGGAPARYDGGLSYVLDLETRRPRRDRVRTSGAVDIMSARSAVEGPLGEGAGFLVGGRALHGLHHRVLESGVPPYGYLDGLVRLDAEPAPGQHLRATGFWNRESVVLDLPRTLAELPGEAPPDGASWGNRAVSLSYRGRTGGTSLEAGVAASRYDAALPLRGVDPVFAEGSSGRVRLTAEAGHPAGSGELRWGASLDRLDVQYGARRLGSGDRSHVEVAAAGQVAGIYADGSWPLGSQVRLRGGLRADRFSRDRGVRAAPRLSVTWLLTEEAAVTLAAGRYHQYARGGASDAQLVAEAEPAGGGAGSSGTDLPVARSSHLVLSLVQTLGDDVRLGLDGFLKSFSGVPEGGGDPLHASGVDLRVLRDGEALTAWLGYSLTWFWSQAAGSSDASSFSGRHLLTAGLAGRIGRRVGADLRLSYGDGLPYTGIPVPSGADAEATTDFARRANEGLLTAGAATLPGGPEDGFLRLDAEVHGIFRPTWGRRTVELRPYVRVLNALDRRDALFYYFEPWRGDDVRPLAELSLLPVLGFEWRF